MVIKPYMDFYKGQKQGYQPSDSQDTNGQENVARLFVSLVLGALLLISGVLFLVNKYESQVNAWLVKNNVQADRRWPWGF